MKKAVALTLIVLLALLCAPFPAGAAEAPVLDSRAVDDAFVARLLVMRASRDTGEAAILGELLDGIGREALGRVLILARHTDTPEGNAFVGYAVSRFDREKLNCLREVIQAELDTRSRLIAATPLEYYSASDVRYAIDDYLGRLGYDLVVEGRFSKISKSTSTPYHEFTTTKGKVFNNVYIKSYMLTPRYGYRENTKDDVRIFIESYDIGNGQALLGVLKIELLGVGTPQRSGAPIPKRR